MVPLCLQRYYIPLWECNYPAKGTFYHLGTEFGERVKLFQSSLKGEVEGA